MHGAEIVEAALLAHRAGDTAVKIASDLGVPRGTIAGWLAGKLPHSYVRDTNGEACGSCGGLRHDFDELPDAYVYLLGLYLGDGCISLGRREVFRLRIALDARYPGIVDECETAMRTVMPRNRVNRSARQGYLEVSSYSKAWPCLFPQHGSGKKHDRPIRLVDWQMRLVEAAPGKLLRGLIHSDGCRFTNTGRDWSHPRYSFTNRSSDIRGIFCSACDRLGIRWTTTGDLRVYVSRKADVALLDSHVGPKA